MYMHTRMFLYCVVVVCWPFLQCSIRMLTSFFQSAYLVHRLKTINYKALRYGLGKENSWEILRWTAVAEINQLEEITDGGFARLNLVIVERFWNRMRLYPYISFDLLDSKPWCVHRSLLIRFGLHYDSSSPNSVLIAKVLASLLSPWL